MVDHVLKTHPEAFQAILTGHKTAEFRRNDRGFKVGQVVRLAEYAPPPFFSVREIDIRITHIADNPEYGIPEGFAMLSFKVMWVKA